MKPSARVFSVTVSARYYFSNRAMEGTRAGRNLQIFIHNYICLIVPGRAKDDLVSGLGKVAGSCARICLMAYTLFNSPRSLSSRSSWLRWSFPTSSSVQEFIGKSGSCICRSGLLPPRFNLPSAAAVSCTTRLLGRVRGVSGIGLPVVLWHHMQPHSPPGHPPKPLQPPLSLQELHMLLSFSFPFFRLFLIFLHSPEFDPHFISCRSLPLLTKNCPQLFLQLQTLDKIKQKLL